MSRKHCTKHPTRGRSNYEGGASATMPRLEDLRKTQNARERQTDSPWPEPWTNDAARLRIIRSGRPMPKELELR